MKIMIVEDEPFSRDMLQGHLEKLGHEVVAFGSGVDAWNQLQREDFPIVISDWMMPGLDGLDLVKRIRARQDGTYVYVILLTAKTEKSDVIKGIMEGADDFLTKPCDHSELNVRIRSGERVIELERRLSAQKETLEHTNGRMKRDLDAAAKFQRSLLPTRTPDNAKVSFAWVYQPCDELAGDFLNVFALDDDHIAVYLVDVSGHGVASALLSVTIGRLMTPLVSNSSLLVQHDGLGGSRIVSPSEVAFELNRRFQMEEQNEMYFTMFYGVLQLSSLEFRYVSAGHDPVVHASRERKPRELDGSNMAIGFVEDEQYDEEVVTLHPGDRLYVYSDGVPEAMDADLNEFSKEQMMEIIEHGQTQSLDASVASLLNAVQRWCIDKGPRDDVSILALEITSNA